MRSPGCAPPPPPLCTFVFSVPSQEHRKGEIVALQEEYRRDVPPAAFGNMLFLLVWRPLTDLRSRKHRDVKWTRIVPCDREGHRLQGAESFNIPHFFLDPYFRVSPYRPTAERTKQILDFLEYASRTSENLPAPVVEVGLPHPTL